MSRTSRVTATAADVTFAVDGVELVASRWGAEGDAFRTSAGVPCVVTAHGFSGTVDSGLDRWGAALAAADYRGFGRSAGAPRQVVHHRLQLEDWRAAIAAAGRLDGVDPRRLVAMGLSFSGGHVLTLAAEDDVPLAACIAMVPFVSAPATLRHLARSAPPSAAWARTRAALADLIAARRGAERVMIPVAADAPEALFSDPAQVTEMVELAGDTWRNEVAAAVGLTSIGYRPIAAADRISIPTLVQVADDDTAAPPRAAVAAARRAGAWIRHYPGDHFVPLEGGTPDPRMVAHQVSFLDKAVGPTSS